MKFEFKGQTYEVDENDVIFSVDASGGITSLTFRKPVELKPRWQVMLSTRNTGNTNTGILFESDDYDACRYRFAFEKERLIKQIKQLILTDDAYRLKVSHSETPIYAVFSIIEERNTVEYYLRLMKV